MSKPPIEMMLDELIWVPLPAPQETPDWKNAPFATHEGVLDIMGHKLRCYQLNTGDRVFDENDIMAFLNGCQPQRESNT